MPLFPENVMHFGFFTNEMECERGKQVFGKKWLFLMQQVCLYLNTKNFRKTRFKKYYTIGLFGKSAKEIVRPPEVGKYLCCMQILLFPFAPTLANFWWFLKCQTDTFLDKQSRSTKNSENFRTRSSFDEITYIQKYHSIVEPIK